VKEVFGKAIHIQHHDIENRFFSKNTLELYKMFKITKYPKKPLIPILVNKTYKFRVCIIVFFFVR
jgi:hypothetical protein